MIHWLVEHFAKLQVGERGGEESVHREVKKATKSKVGKGRGKNASD